MVAWICFAIAAGGGSLALCILVLGRTRLQRPDLATWEKGEPAWESPPLLCAVRERSAPARQPSLLGR